MDPVHHNAGYRLHAGLSLSAGLAFNEAGQQLSVGISHKYFTLLLWNHSMRQGPLWCGGKKGRRS